MTTTILHLLQQGGSGSAFMQFVPFLLIMGVFWLILIRPQTKERKKQEQMRAALEKGDRVVTSSGIIGRIQTLKDQEVVLDLENGRIRILRETVVRRLGENGEASSVQKAG